MPSTAFLNTPTTFQVRLNLTEPLFKKYQAAAKAKSQDVEEYISTHLAQTVGQDHSGAGIWFGAPDARALCDITGRGPCTDPKVINDRLRSLAQIVVGDVVVDLDAQVWGRLKHIPSNTTPEQFITKHARNGVRNAVGLSPK